MINNFQVTGRNKKYTQLDVLFQIEKIQKKYDSIRRKSKRLVILSRFISKKRQEEKISDLKKRQIELIDQQKKLREKLKPDYHLTSIREKIKKNQKYLFNLEKEFKTNTIDKDTYETSKLHYIQRINEFNAKLRKIHQKALEYFLWLKKLAFKLEKYRIYLKKKVEMKEVSLNEYKGTYKKIEQIKKQIRSLLRFLNSCIIQKYHF
jgi:chromosome segregation ATPase